MWKLDHCESTTCSFVKDAVEETGTRKRSAEEAGLIDIEREKMEKVNFAFIDFSLRVH